MKETLKKLDLSDTEINVYLALLPLGKAQASVIGYRTKQKRSTVRHACQRLVEKGLIRMKKQGNTFVFIAEPPEKIIYLLEEESRKVQDKKDEMSRIIGEIKAIMNPSIILPKIKFLTGKEGFVQFCEESLQCKNKEILFLTSMEHYRNIVTKEYDTEHYIPERIKKKIFLRLLCVRTPLTEEMKREDKEKLREIRFLPKKYFIKNTLFIFDEITTLISNETNPSCVMIRSQEITDTMRTFYEFAWDKAERK